MAIDLDGPGRSHELRGIALTVDVLGVDALGKGVRSRERLPGSWRAGSPTTSVGSGAKSPPGLSPTNVMETAGKVALEGGSTAGIRTASPPDGVRPQDSASRSR